MTPSQYFTDGLTSSSHNLTLTANPAQSGQNNAGMFLDIDRIVVLNTSNGTTTKDDSGIIARPSPVPNPIPSAVGGLQKLQDATQGSTRSHSSNRPHVALIGGAIVGIFLLLLLITLAIILFRRRGVQPGGGLRPKLSIRVVRQPKTPVLPMQFPPPWGMTPQTPDAPNPFLHPGDLEKGVRFPAPKGLEEEKDPFTDDARVELPSVPEMSVIRAGKGGRQLGDGPVAESAERTVRQVSS